MDTLTARFKSLRVRLREELVKRGYVPSPFFETIDGQLIAADFSSDGQTIVVRWGPPSNRRKMHNPNAALLAESMIEAVKEQKGQSQPKTKAPSSKLPEPPPPKVPRKSIVITPEPKRRVFTPPPPEGSIPPEGNAKATRGVFITDEEYKEYQRLKSMAEHGIWMGKDVYNAMQEEMRAGYIGPADRDRLRAAHDHLLRSITEWRI